MRTVLQGLVGQSVGLGGGDGSLIIGVGPGQTGWQLTELGDDFVKLSKPGHEIYIAVAHISRVAKTT